jgi:hypothetical protein
MLFDKKIILCSIDTNNQIIKIFIAIKLNLKVCSLKEK